jgi:hypothetical protein
MAKKLEKILAKSKKKTDANRALAEKQAKAAQLGLKFGHKNLLDHVKLGFINKTISASKRIQLRTSMQQEEIQDEITESLLDAMDAQDESLNLSEKMNDAIDASESLFGDLGSTIKDIVKNPMTAAIGLITQFAAMTDTIGDSFGAIGVTKFRDDLAKANIEFVKMGLSGEDAFLVIENLGTEFGIGTERALELADTIGGLQKTLGLAVEEAAPLVGMMTEMGGLTEEQAENLAKSTALLADANGVAPKEVLKDIAANTEIFAKFSGLGADKLFRASIQAKKLGVSIEDIAGAAEGLLSFQDSLNAEIEASVILGRNLNLQKARELSLAGDLEGLAVEITKQVGSQADFEKMNVVERKALASALGLNLQSLNKIVMKEKEQVTLAGELAKQDLSNMLPEDTMSKVAKVLADLQVTGMELIEDIGPDLVETFSRVAEPVVMMVAQGAELIKWLHESIGLTNLLALRMGVAAGAATANLAIAIATSYAKGASAPPGPWTIPLLIGLPLLVGGLVTAIMSSAMSAGDMISEAKGKTMVSTKEGGLFELSKNDDLLAGPGLASAMGAGGGGSVVNNIDTSNLVRENKEIKNEMSQLRKEMASYFGFGGTMYREARGTNQTLVSAQRGT